MGIRIPLTAAYRAGGIRIATGISCPRNDRALAGAARVGGGVRAPRPTEGYGGAVGAGRRDADPYELDKMPVGRGQCAPPLGVRRLSGGGTHGCRPTEKFAKHA